MHYSSASQATTTAVIYVVAVEVMMEMVDMIATNVKSRHQICSIPINSFKILRILPMLIIGFAMPAYRSFKALKCEGQDDESARPLLRLSLPGSLRLL